MIRTMRHACGLLAHSLKATGALDWRPGTKHFASHTNMGDTHVPQRLEPLAAASDRHAVGEAPLHIVTLYTLLPCRPCRAFTAALAARSLEPWSNIKAAPAYSQSLL